MAGEEDKVQMPFQCVTIQLRTKFAVPDPKGQCLGIFGSHEAIGCWDESRPLLANNVWQDFWEVCFSVPAGTRIEWKWIVYEVTGKQITHRESTQNRNLVAPNSDSYMSVPWEEEEGFMMPLFKNTKFQTSGKRKHKVTSTSPFPTHVLQKETTISTIPTEINSRPHGKSAKAFPSTLKKITSRHQDERRDKVSANISSKTTKRKISTTTSPTIPGKVYKYVHDGVVASFEKVIVPAMIYEHVSRNINANMGASFEKDIKTTIFLDKVSRNMHAVTEASFGHDITYKEFADDVAHNTDKNRTREPQRRTSVLLAVPTIIFGTGVLAYMAYKKAVLRCSL